MEYWDIYDEKRNFTGKKKGKYEKWEDFEYHLATECWVINSDNEILIQQRSQKCEILPGIWAMTTGRVVSGEDTLNGGIRELKEELGIATVEEDFKLIESHISRNMIWDIYFVRKNVELDKLVLQEEEVSDAKLVTTDELRKMLKDGTAYEYDEIYELLDIIDRGF